MTKRIQRKRVKGWKMPPNTIYVGRPTRWGNMFKVPTGRALSLTSPEWAVTMFAYDLVMWRAHEPEAFEKWIAPLRDKDLACWCPIGQTCHADVLLRLARMEPGK